ncbi:MAG: MFS transporter [Mesorhizobium sp.]
MPSRSSTFAPFQNQNFRALWSATLVSNLGGLVQGVGAGWMMTTITDSHSMVALVQGATTLPIMIFSLVSGALADNFDRRRIMLFAQIGMMLVSVALAACAYAGIITPWMLLGFTFLLGCGVALHNPPWQASMGDIVPRADLPAAVTLNSMGFNLMRSVGPAIGGIIVAAAGIAAAFLVNALSYVALIWTLWRWKPAYPKSHLPREKVFSAMAAGLRYVSMSPNLLTVMLRGFVFGVTAVSALALLPLVASDLLSGGALTYGGLLGAFGVGALIGGALNGRVREKLSNEWIVRLTCLIFGISNILLSFSSNTWVSLALLLPAGASWVLALSLFNVTIQLSTPRWVVGRALALYQTATFGGLAIGSWLWGAVADGSGSRAALLISGLALVASIAIGLRLRLPAFSSLNLDPADRFTEPELRLDLRARSGPIMIMIDYTIERDNVPAFLAAMTERRRIRIRDGARQWALLRDLENPETWTESYHVPTWVEYLRHNHHLTQADIEVMETLRGLHKGPARPRVHRMIERQTVPQGDDMPLKENPPVP